MPRPTVRALETPVNGILYRSRLEARWALFFSYLRIPFEYEWQGYQLNSGARFLPDFWLPQTTLRGWNHRDAPTGLFVEIKATAEHIRDNEDRYQEFGSEYPLIVFAGKPPGEGDVSDFLYDGGYEFSPQRGWSDSELDSDPSRVVRWDNQMLVCVCIRCGASRVEFSEGHYLSCSQCGCSDVRSAVEIAADAANNFRFDHWRA